MLTNETSSNKLIVIAGATGELGSRIAKYIIRKDANVRALVRNGSTNPEINNLAKEGVDIVTVDFSKIEELTNACKGAFCVISAVSGLQDVIVDLQTRLLQAAIEAGATRFIPSDFSADFRGLKYGNNRNLDFRKIFRETADKAPIQVTSILNGMFMDLLLGQAPVILFKIKRILYWGNKHQPLDFTTIDNTAEYTACVALDDETPRWLCIAGDTQTTKQLSLTATEVMDKKFSTLRAGGLGLLRLMIKITRTLAPAKKEIFPPWQGMQYLHDMLSGEVKLNTPDNNRYLGIKWTSVKDLLTQKR